MNGLCGNFDGDSENDLGDLPGVTVEEFGNSWKVDGSCPDAEEPVKTKCEVRF